MINTEAKQSVPEGYKQTEVGVIPEDWDVLPLNKLVSFENGDRSSNYPSASEFVDFGVPFINAGHVSAGKINNAIMDYVPEYVYNRLGGGKVKAGDLVFCLRGSLGKFGIIDSNFGKGAIASSLVIVRPNLSKTSTGFVSSYFKSEICKDMIELWAGGAAQPNLGAREFGLFLAPVPPSKEQSAIANALTDVDALITELEKLIAKKKAIKTATMQQLLTGRTRLPQFALREDGTRKGTKPSELGKIPEDWEIKQLKDVCGSFTTGKLDANTMKANGEYRFYTCAKNHYWIDSYAFDDEALLVSGNGANVGYVHYYNGKFNAYQRTYVLTGFRSNIFFIKLFLEQRLAERIRVEVNAGNTPYITMDTLTDMEILIPVDKQEQAAIAETLTDMDAEISALEHRLGKTRQIKQGMMQELLTGKTRLLRAAPVQITASINNCHSLGENIC